MKTTIKSISLLSLVACLALPVLFFLGALGETGLKNGFLIASVIWFFGAVLWGRKDVKA